MERKKCSPLKASSKNAALGQEVMGLNYKFVITLQVRNIYGEIQ
jgi:hypothetical protein